MYKIDFVCGNCGHTEGEIGIEYDEYCGDTIFIECVNCQCSEKVPQYDKTITTTTKAYTVLRPIK